MFPASSPDLMGQLVQERIASLREDARRSRRSTPFRARWLPARFVEPAADLSRVVPSPAAETAETGRAA